jgi:hypothetical protein
MHDHSRYWRDYDSMSMIVTRWHHDAARQQQYARGEQAQNQAFHDWNSLVVMGDITQDSFAR